MDEDPLVLKSSRTLGNKRTRQQSVLSDSYYIPFNNKKVSVDQSIAKDKDKIVSKRDSNPSLLISIDCRVVTHNKK